MTYEEMKEIMKDVPAQQTELNKKVNAGGTRYQIPLKGREIEVVIYKKNAQDPVMFCAYGGGFSFGACVLDDILWREIHRVLGVTLVSIGYRRAPENPFPCALEDVYETILYVEQNKEKYGIDTEDFSVYGNSAGGNLATGVCLLNVRRGGKLHIKRQILNYPYCDLHTTPKEKGHLTTEERHMYRMFAESYCKAEENENPLISPVFTDEEDLKDMPRAIVTLAEADPLLPEGARYIFKLRAAGIQVDSHIAVGMHHGYSEIYFLGGNDYMQEDERKALEDGTMKARVYETLDFIKEHF